MPLLRQNGIGEIAFGAERASVVAYLTEILGLQPVEEPPPFGQVTFGRLSLQLESISDADGREREVWTSWRYGGTVAAGPPNLSTVEGLGIGSTVGDLFDQFADFHFEACADELIDVTWITGDRGSGNPESSSLLSGHLSGDAGQIGAMITSLAGGTSC